MVTPGDVNPLAASHSSTSPCRLLLYKPGYALVVLDFARSSGVHDYSRLFQLGPDLRVKQRGQAVDLSGPHGFVARLTSSGTSPSRLTLHRGQKKPLRGFIFPSYRKAVPRTTAEYKGHGADVNEVATFALDRSNLARARLLPHSSPADATIRLAGPGSSTLVHVVRSGSQLSVFAR